MAIYFYRPLPSHSVANYDHHNTNISTTRSTAIGSLCHDTKSLLPELFTGYNDLDLTLKLLSLLSPEAEPSRHNNNWLLFQFYFPFDDFSQSTACIANRSGECSSTLLDKLWYTYSYIYKTTTTICYRIYIFLNSRHKSISVITMCQAYYYSFCINSLISYTWFYYSQHTAVIDTFGVCICSSLINYLGYFLCEFLPIYHLPVSNWCWQWR